MKSLQVISRDKVKQWATRTLLVYAIISIIFFFWDRSMRPFVYFGFFVLINFLYEVYDFLRDDKGITVDFAEIQEIVDQVYRDGFNAGLGSFPLVGRESAIEAAMNNIRYLTTEGPSKKLESTLREKGESEKED